MTQRAKDKLIAAIAVILLLIANLYFQIRDQAVAQSTNEHLSEIRDDVNHIVSELQLYDIEKEEY